MYQIQIITLISDLQTFSLGLWLVFLFCKQCLLYSNFLEKLPQNSIQLGSFMNQDLAGSWAVFNYYFRNKYQSLQIALISLFLPTFLVLGLCNVLLLKECFLQLFSIIHNYYIRCLLVGWQDGGEDEHSKILQFCLLFNGPVSWRCSLYKCYCSLSSDRQPFSFSPVVFQMYFKAPFSFIFLPS